MSNSSTCISFIGTDADATTNSFNFDGFDVLWVLPLTAATDSTSSFVSIGAVIESVICFDSAGSVFISAPVFLIFIDVNGDSSYEEKGIQEWLPLLLAHVLMRDPAVPALN